MLSLESAFCAKGENPTVYIPKGLVFFQMACRPFKSGLTDDGNADGAGAWPSRKEYASLSAVFGEIEREYKFSPLQMVALNPWSLLYGGEWPKVSKAFESYFVLCLNPSFEDLAAAKRLAGLLFAGGFRREDIFFAVFHGKISPQVPPEMITGELGAPPIHVNLDLKESDFFHTIVQIGPKKILESKMGKCAIKLVDLIEKKSIGRAAGGEESGSFIDWRDIEERVTGRTWNLLNAQGNRSFSNKAEIETLIEKEIHAAVWDGNVVDRDRETIKAVQQRILDRVTGLGPIEPFFRDSSVHEIMVNGPECIFVEKDGAITKTDEKFVNEAHLKVTIDRMVGEVGRRVDTSSPICDLRLENGSRVNIVLPPLSLEGPLVTIRRFRPQILTMEKLIELGSVRKVEAEYLKEAVRSRKNILIAGNSGAGKTTLLNIMSFYIDDSERIITLEDAAELKLQKSHVVRLEIRPKNSEGAGEINMRELVINALRMRPDRLIIGECRGSEVVPMLQALNTGHQGSMTTVHANSALDAIKRIEAMVLMAAPNWPIEVVREQIGTAIDLIIFLSRIGTSRKLLEIGKVRLEGGRAMIERLEAKAGSL